MNSRESAISKFIVSPFSSCKSKNGSSVNDVRAMTNILGVYRPVMLAHYKPNNGDQATFEADVRAMLNDTYLADATSAGLFAWSFMDDTNLSVSESVYQYTKDAVLRYGTTARWPIRA